MAWIGKSEGLFRLHDSDNFCGSYISVDDVAEILEVPLSSLAACPSTTVDNQRFVSELDIHKEWGSGRIQSPQKPKLGTATRSFDELIVRKLFQITLVGCHVECQIPFGRKHVDLKITHDNWSLFVEFVVPVAFHSPVPARTDFATCAAKGGGRPLRVSVPDMAILDTAMFQKHPRAT